MRFESEHEAGGAGVGFGEAGACGVFLFEVPHAGSAGVGGEGEGAFFPEDLEGVVGFFGHFGDFGGEGVGVTFVGFGEDAAFFVFAEEAALSDAAAGFVDDGHGEAQDAVGGDGVEEDAEAHLAVAFALLGVGAQFLCESFEYVQPWGIGLESGGRFEDEWGEFGGQVGCNADVAVMHGSEDGVGRASCFQGQGVETGMGYACPNFLRYQPNIHIGYLLAAEIIFWMISSSA